MSLTAPRWNWWLTLLVRQIWFRAALFALLSVAGALLAVVLGPFIPPGVASDLGANAVGNILEILASSMLIVATFSLSTMISAYAAASSSTTPRVTELLMQDPMAQNALSTFVGGFLFSLVGIIGLSTGIYGEDGLVVLFALTLLVVIVIVVTFLRWVDALSNFGRVPDAIERTAQAAADAVSGWTEHPFLGGRRSDRAPERACRVTASRMGYVRHIDVPALQRLAEEREGEVLVTALPGEFLDADCAIAESTFDADEKALDTIRAAFDIGDSRTFDQDPQYGISALAEIGIKALSPGINDPVTALRVIDRLVRVLTVWGNAAVDDGEPTFNRVYVPPLDADEMFGDAFTELALHGAHDVTVGLRLQRAFRSLARVKCPNCATAARRQAELALARAELALAVKDDYEKLEALHRS